MNNRNSGTCYTTFNMKSCIALVVIVLLCQVAFYVFDGPEKLGLTETATPTVQRVSPTAAEVFTFTLEEEVQKKIGQPIEGYEPAMFLQLFPGLVATDFEGVEASIGYYTIKQGKLVHELGEERTLVHSAAGAITRAGMARLLENVAARTSIDLEADGTLTDIMSAISER